MQMPDLFPEKGPFPDYNTFRKKYEIRVPSKFSLVYDILDAYALTEPDRTALVLQEPDGSWKSSTFLELKRLSDQAANFLLARGVRSGDTILSLLPPCREFWILLFAAAKTGARVLAASRNADTGELAALLDGTTAKMVLMENGEDVFGRVAPALRRAPFVRAIACTGYRTGFLCFPEEIRKQDRLFYSSYWEKRSADDPLLLLPARSDSGTLLSYSHRTLAGEALTGKYTLGLSDGAVCLFLSGEEECSLSMTLPFGCWLAGGAAAFPAPDAAEKAPGALLRSLRPAALCASGSVLRGLAEEDGSGMPPDLSVLAADETLSDEEKASFAEKTGRPVLVSFRPEGFCPVLADFPALAPPRGGSLGLVSPLYETVLLDENGKIRKDAREGEIAVRIRKKQAGFPALLLPRCGAYAEKRNGLVRTGLSVRTDPDGNVFPL